MPVAAHGPPFPSYFAAEALLAQKDAIVNWPQFYAGNNMTGWAPCSCSSSAASNGRTACLAFKPLIPSTHHGSCSLSGAAVTREHVVQPQLRCPWPAVTTQAVCPSNALSAAVTAALQVDRPRLGPLHLEWRAV